MNADIKHMPVLSTQPISTVSVLCLSRGIPHQAAGLILSTVAALINVTWNSNVCRKPPPDNSIRSASWWIEAAGACFVLWQAIAALQRQKSLTLDRHEIFQTSVSRRGLHIYMHWYTYAHTRSQKTITFIFKWTDHRGFPRIVYPELASTQQCCGWTLLGEKNQQLSWSRHFILFLWCNLCDLFI